MVTRKDRSTSHRSDVIRTRKAIEDAYHNLLFSKPYNKITVTDVIKEAKISRGTFYAYFSDIKELGDCVEEQMIDRLKELIRSAVTDNAMRDPGPVIDVLTADMEAYRDGIRVLFEKNDGLRFHEKLKARLRTALPDVYEDIKQPERGILISCMVATMLDTCINWVLKDDPCDRETLVDDITGFMTEGIAYFYRR